MRLLPAAVLLASLVAGCGSGGPATLSPTVVVDGAFSPAERAGVAAALAAWEGAAPALRFSHEVEGHADIIGDALGNPGDRSVIYVVRVEGGADRDCPNAHRSFWGDPPDTMAATLGNVVCIAAPIVDGDAAENGYDAWRAVPMHELGHALGLGHSADPASVMVPQAAAQPPAPGAGDVAALMAAHR